MKALKEKGYEHYLIDKNGNVFNTKAARGLLKNEPKLLKSYPNKNTGYMTVVLRNGVKAKSFYVHRLVASAYISNPLNLPEVNHKNHNRSDNSVTNLEWVTKKQNIQHAYSNKEKKLDKILKDKKLIQQGIKHYEWNKDMNYLAKLWNTDKIKCSKILKMHNIERSRFKIPNSIRAEIINDIKSHNMKRGKFINYIKDKYNIHFTRFHLMNLKKML